MSNFNFFSFVNYVAIETWRINIHCDQIDVLVKVLYYLQDLYSCNKFRKVGVRVMVFNATFNDISVISWQSVLLGEETEVPGENHRPTTSH